ncbi:hypothetical protein SCHPADRAFT_823532, partial [Schizopora paradoxa]
RCAEALTRAGRYHRELLPKSISMFEDFSEYLNHVDLCSEEISATGEACVHHFVQINIGGEVMTLLISSFSIASEMPFKLSRSCFFASILLYHSPTVDISTIRIHVTLISAPHYLSRTLSREPPALQASRSITVSIQITRKVELTENTHYQ